MVEERDAEALLQRPSYDPASGMFVLDRDHEESIYVPEQGLTPQPPRPRPRRTARDRGTLPRRPRKPTRVPKKAL